MKKEYYESMLMKLVDPLKDHYSTGGAGLKLGAFAAGYGNRIGDMEGFSRVLWGMASYWAGGGTDKSLLELYQKGLANGTDPDSEEYWGDLHNKDQKMVEMAAISYGILIIPDQLWAPLNERSKENLANWLYQINEYSLAENNWQFFKVIANLALKSIGKKWSKEQVQIAMDKYESFYIGNGWYSDGRRPQKDYYTSFGIHFYCLLYSKFMEKEDPVHAKIFKDRAVEFAKTFIYWFDDEGKALPFGRSLTYRFAEAAFFSVCTLAGVECGSWGVMKGIIERHLEYWMRQPIFDNGGVLTVGYTYPNLLMSEAYNSPGSAYWALKTFVFLALEETHPFWSAEAEPLPKLKSPLALKECDMLISHREHEVVALTAGQYPTLDHPFAAEKYAKFAYSSQFGFCVSRSFHSIEQSGTDSMLAFYIHGMHYVRRTCEEYYVSEQEVYSRWSPVEGIMVKTWLIPEGCGHRRRHVITSTLPENTPCIAYDCGFSYPNCMDKTKKATNGTEAMVSDENGFSRVRSTAGEPAIIAALPNMNLIFPNVFIPATRFTVTPGETKIETLVETEFTNKTVLIGGGNCYAIQNG